MTKLLQFTTILLVVGACCALAAGPNLMSYQGQVLTSTGAPIANGSYPASFVFFSVASGGAPLWSEPTTIATSSGIFTHMLGSTTPIPAGFFANNSSLWLEITVNGQVQTPRTQMTSVGYSQSVNTIDSASGGTITSNVTVDGGLVLGKASVLAGSLNVMSPASGGSVLSLHNYGSWGGAMWLAEHTGAEYFGAIPALAGAGGTIYLKNGFGGYGLIVNGNNTGGYPAFQMDGMTSVQFDLSNTSNYSVNFPDSAISAVEMLNEPGLTSFNSATGVIPTTGAMQDLATVSITIPSAGYISLIGQIGEVDLCGTMGSNWVFAQIDETAGGFYAAPYYSVFGATAFPSTGCTWGSMNCQRVYYKASPGTYTFRLEIQQGSTSPGSSSIAYFPTLTATYFPTSYGSVVTAASSNEASEFESAKLNDCKGSALTSVSDITNNYSVDLRELEMKASKLESEAQRVRAAIVAAKLREQLISQPSSVDNK